MTTTNDTARAEALTERLFEAAIGTLELYSVYLGWRLGLYETLQEGPLTRDELADRTGIDARYALEWLEQQAVAGFLEVDDPGLDDAERRFTLPEAHAPALALVDHELHVAPFGAMVVGVAGALPEVVEAYRAGRGVPYEHYGSDFRDGQGAINRPAFVNELADWFRAIPDLDARLSADPPARVADVGCGQGFSTIAIAKAYPNARVEGIDLDAASVADAERAAKEAGVGDGLVFRQADAASLAASGPYDLACIFEALHDMARPVEALAALRDALSDDGRLLVMDERVADTFTAPGDEVERMMYGWSVTHCLPASRAEEPSAALGTALRASTVEALGRQAGFSTVDVLPIENDFFRFYLMTP